jgi:hypothetical protein
MIRARLKVWQAGLQPWSRPFPDYRREAVIFKPCACSQLGYRSAEKNGALKAPLGGALASVLSAATSKPIKLMIFA